MDKNDKERFSEIMLGLAENFGGSVSPEGMRSRFAAMAEYSVEQVARAGAWLIKNREQTFPPMPTVKEVIDTIQAQESPRITGQSRAQVQVDVVLDKLRHQGRNAPVDFQDPITFGLMTARWPYNSWAATVTEAQLTWWRKEFVQAYQAHTEQKRAEQIALPANDRLKSLASGVGK